MMWDRVGLEAQGFAGFVPFAALPRSDVPREPGVYVVMRLADEAPAFLHSSVAGRFKGRDPSIAAERLEANWVTGTQIVYIGKATPGRDGRRGIRQRLDEYRRIGAGEAVGHWGGRLIWQLADWNELVIAWKETPDEDAGAVESRMLVEFVADHGKLPFANLRH